MCFDEELPGFLLRCGGFGLQTPELLDGSAAAGLSFDLESQSEEGSCLIGNVEVSVEMLGPLLMARALQLDRVLPSIKYDGKKELSSGVV